MSFALLASQDDIIFFSKRKSIPLIRTLFTVLRSKNPNVTDLIKLSAKSFPTLSTPLSPFSGSVVK